MSRLSRIRYILGLAGLIIIFYIAYKGRYHLGYLGLVMGFVAGFLIDASVREKSLLDNLLMGLFFSAILGLYDIYTGITPLVREHIGDGFLLATLVLSAVILIGSMMDEIRIGRTVRISYAPTVAVILSLIVLSYAVTTQEISYTRSSHFGGTRTTGVDAAFRVTTNSSSLTTYSPTPVLNGSKANTFTAPTTSANITYIELAIYRVSNTTRVRHAGDLYIKFSISLNTTPVSVDLLFLKAGSTFHRVNNIKINRNATTLEGTIKYSLSSVDTYYANIADFVMLKINLPSTPATSITVSINDMHIAGEKVLDTHLAYISLALLALAALLAIPESATTRVRKRLRRR